MTLELKAGTFDGLIFDCDGTLVDTAPAHLFALQEALKPMDLSMSEEWYMPRVGLTPAALLDAYEAEIVGGPVERERIYSRYGEVFQGSLGLLREFSVVADIARRWKGKVPVAVASNGHRENVEKTLGVTGLLPLFDFIVAAEDVERGKPEPDVFLEAARRMGVEAGRCVVFEDSDEGMEAARRAGMDARDVRGMVRR